MKNITITLRHDTADWLKVEAAKAGLSMSAFISQQLENRMGRGKDQIAALDKFLSGAGYAGISANLPTRDELYDRPALRRHQHSDLRARSSRATETHGVSGFAEADDQEPYTHAEPAKPE